MASTVSGKAQNSFFLQGKDSTAMLLEGLADASTKDAVSLMNVLLPSSLHYYNCVYLDRKKVMLFYLDILILAVVSQLCPEG